MKKQKRKEDLDFDGDWEAHNCYVEKCEFCNEEPEDCKCSDNERK